MTGRNYCGILSLVIEKGGYVENKKFDRLWQKLLKSQPANEHLSRIIYAVEPLRKKAFQQLLKQNPENWRIREVILYESLREEAAEQLLRRNPSNEDLLWIILFVKSLKTRAWEQLLKQGIRPEDLDEVPWTKPLIEERWEIRKRVETGHDIVQRMKRLVKSSS